MKKYISVRHWWGQSLPRRIILPPIWTIQRWAFIISAKLLALALYRPEPLGTIEEFKAWYATMKPTVPKDDSSHHPEVCKTLGPYFVGDYFCADFNRDVIRPGQHPKAPRGVLQIRFDGDFWIAARLPYRFREVPLDQIINVIYPDEKDFSIEPDSNCMDED